MKYINPKVNIRNPNPYDMGWIWDHSVVDPAGIKHEGTYMTNVLGEGLYRDIPGNPKQILGNCQFGLSRDRKTAYQQIRRWIIQQYRMQD